MKLVLTNRILLDKALLFILLLFVFLIPVNKKILPFLIAILVLLWLARGSFSEKFNSLKQSVIFFLLIVFYFLHLIGMINTENVPSGFFDLEVKFALLLFPIIMFSLRDFIIINRNYIFSAFVFGNVAAGSACLLNSYFNGPKEVFYYFQYSEFSLFHHPSYASMYALFSICILLVFLVKNPFQGMKYFKLLYTFLTLVLFAYIFFLSSRTGTIAAIITLGFIGVYYLYIIKKWILLACVAAVVIILPVLVVKFHPRFIPVERFLNTPLDSLDISSGENVTIRYVVVRNSVDLIKERFFTGAGTGDVKDELMKMYKEKKIMAASEQKINAHNQYIETFIGLGLGGILSLFLLIFIPLNQGVRHKNILAISFSLIIVINFMFESMLNTQAGVIFFAFFTSLFCMGEKPETSNQQPATRNQWPDSSFRQTEAG